MNQISQLQTKLQALSSSETSVKLMRFFKTGKGDYGENDQFLGVTVPDLRKLAKQYTDNLSLYDVQKLLNSQWHEERLVALLILVEKFKKADNTLQKEIFDFYLKNTQQINNWDLVDLSCGAIVGSYLIKYPSQQKILDRLAKSSLLWERRIAIVSTIQFTRYQKDVQPTLRIAQQLLSDEQDLIRKATGWALREVGKNDDRILTNFLQNNYHQISRTTLRYAIEKFSPEKRKKMLSGNFSDL